MSRRSPPVAARALASAFSAGEWEVEAMARRGRQAVGGRRLVWLRVLARAVQLEFPVGPVERLRELAAYIAECPPYLDARPTARAWLPAPTAMGPMRWPVQALNTRRDLAEWLGLTPGELAWFADARSLERTVADEELRHYRCTWVAKPGGGARLLERPKPRLKAIQRQILDEVLGPIPAHEAAHGFVRGRSVMTGARPHVGQRVVVRLDLESFFPTIRGGRVFGILRAVGYPEPVAHALTGLTTTVVPMAAWRAAPAGTSWHLGRALATPHLPQGAPTSPALANLAAHRLDRRLAGLAVTFGAAYTRYADDLAFSGDGQLERLIPGARDIAEDEGFRLNEAKTTVRRRHQRQRVAGVVVNARPNAARDEVDRLKALLHNAARHGPASQNRDGHPDFRAHLLGRISWVASLNPERGVRLRNDFDRIDWD